MAPAAAENKWIQEWLFLDSYWMIYRRCEPWQSLKEKYPTPERAKDAPVFGS
jgi:hypothetical protein